MNNHRGQVATEFLLYTTVFLFIVIAAFLVVNHIQETEIPTREYSVARETGGAFAHVVTLAIKGGQGFSYNYTFPRTLFSAANRLGTPYRIYFLPDSQMMIMEWNGSYGEFSYSYSVPAYDYVFVADDDCIVYVEDEDPADGIDENIHYLDSGRCSRLYLANDGEVLTISRG